MACHLTSSATCFFAIAALYRQPVEAWTVGETLAWPKYPTRQVFVLNGSWDFAFLGDVTLEAAATVREEDLLRRVRLPDAFDTRSWLCSSGCDGAVAGGSCSRCCDGTLGPEQSEGCWRNGRTFQHCCDPVAAGRRGIAAYRTFVPRQVSLLHFHACSMRCAVYRKRQLHSIHIGGYSPFWVDFTEPAAQPALGCSVDAKLQARSSSCSSRTANVKVSSDSGEDVELLVLADNRFSPEWPVHQPYFDWYQAGGLLRAVEAHILAEPQHYFRRAAVLPVMPMGNVVIQVLLSEGCIGKGFYVSVSFDGAPLLPGFRLVGSHGPEEAWQEQVPRPQLWSLEAPELHIATLGLWRGGTQIDLVSVRFGLRSIQSRDGRMLLNSHLLEVMGVNRHESHSLGSVALSMEQLRNDVAILKQLGVNFVRGAHYSQDQRFLDLCDETGILVWEETLSWQPSLQLLNNPLFMEQQMCALEETMNASLSHPSVIMWGFLNEGEAEVLAARPAYAALAGYAHAHDPTRLVTWGSRRKMQDVTLDLADVISFNDYPGWYDASVDAIPNVWGQYAEWARQHHPGKPILMSEVGAEGLVGYHTGGGELRRWSEELQAAIISASVLAAHASGFAGVVLWQFADCSVDLEPFFRENPRQSPVEGGIDLDWVEQLARELGATTSLYGSHLPLRPRGLNNKGLVSLDRGHRKLAFTAAHEAFNAACMAAVSQLPGGWPAASKLTEANGADHVLSVHTWNSGDRPKDQPGLRVHGHRLKARASHWTVEPNGLIRLTGHADGRLTGLGWFLSVALSSDRLQGHVVVREAPSNLWAIELMPQGSIFLRVSWGPACGAYISLFGFSAEDERDENSAYATVRFEKERSTAWHTSS